MKNLFLSLLLVSMFFAYSDESGEYETSVYNAQDNHSSTTWPEAIAQREFAIILSKAVHNNQVLREFLKKESIKSIKVSI